ncbi:GntR family transcriptional regulator [Fulvimarina endophytica]|uniref:GntR family transcriptional regulator n=2 Tax=Fulvimarina endophytica TaxID=2293836 RepID=A0A371WZ86_9HYPH|nr:GntR family transcriptional regulator [Fulvimarina endophytica]RFC62301.1 GntR family transcriptional regulator [Fulvimarina endophytica]
MATIEGKEGTGSLRTGQTIRRNYLHDTAATRLREMIRSGAFKPGDRINEGDLAVSFGISRTPMREAIKMLAAEDLLEILPNYGPRVRLIDRAELVEMLEIIAILEATAGERACALVNDADIEELQRLHDAMLDAWKAGDKAGYFDRNRQIHDAIVRLSGNTTLQRIYHSLSGRIQVARYSSNKTDEQWKRAVGEHEAMLRFLRERDAASLFSVMRDHVRSQENVIALAYGVEADAARRA